MQHTPGRLSKRGRRFLLVVPVVALGATGIWLFAREPRSDLDAARKRAAAVGAASGALAEALAKVGLEPDPTAYVQARAGKEDTTALSELVNAYAAWASRGDAVEARRLIVTEFLEHPDMKVGMEALLNAVALDTTPRKQDPMWRDLVDGVGRQWNAMTFDWGRDRVQTEPSPKAKDLLLESLAGIPAGTLTTAQQGGLVTDLIDLYPSASPDQKPALDKALAALAGPDVVEILHHRGIDEGSAPLASIQKINQELEASRSRYKKVLEQIEQDERAAKEANAREAANSQR